MPAYPGLDPYLTYYVLGNAGDEAQKLYRPERWPRLAAHLDELLRPFGKKATQRGELHEVERLPPRARDGPDSWLTTHRAVPHGGQQRWSADERPRWSEALEGDGGPRALDEPGARRIELHSVRLLAAASRSLPPDVQVVLKNRACYGRDGRPVPVPCDQVLVLSLAASVQVGRSLEAWDVFARALGALACAVRVARCTRPWALERPLGPGSVAASLLGDANLDVGPLGLESTWQTWTELAR